MNRITLFCLLLLVLPLAGWAGGFERCATAVRFTNGQPTTAIHYVLRTPTADLFFRSTGFSIVSKTIDEATHQLVLKRTDVAFEGGLSQLPVLQQEAGIEQLIYTNVWAATRIEFRRNADQLQLLLVMGAEASGQHEFRFSGAMPEQIGVYADSSVYRFGGQRWTEFHPSGNFCYRRRPPTGRLNGNRFAYTLTSSSVAVWTTYCGGSDADELYGEALCPNGDLLVAGRTQSLNFPVDTNAVQVANAGNYDAFIARVKPDGTKRWATYYGGSGFETAWSIAMIGEQALVVGGTNSADFPVVNAAQPTLGGGFDAFVVRLDSNGSVIWSTYFGGSQTEQGLAIATDAAGRIYIGGSGNSANMPQVANGWQTTPGGQLDGFVARLTATGAPLWSTFCGGTATEDVHDLTVGPQGQVGACGETYSLNFPTTPGAFQTGITGGNDAYLLVMDSLGNRTYSTCLGGYNGEDANGVRFDAAGNCYLAGFTQSIDFPVTGNQFQNFYNGNSDAFVARFNPNGQLYWATYIGSGSNETALTLALLGKYLYVGGSTDSPGFPVTTLAHQDTLTSGNDGFYCKLDTAGNWIMSSFLGGSGFDGVYGLVIRPDTLLYVVGNTFSNNLPTLSGVWQSTYTSLGDGFIAIRDASEELSGNAVNTTTSPLALSLWPNPAGDVVHILTDAPVRSVEVWDAAGRCVLNRLAASETTLQLHVATLPAGHYQVRVLLADGHVLHTTLVR